MIKKCHMSLVYKITSKHYQSQTDDMRSPYDNIIVEKFELPLETILLDYRYIPLL